MRCIALIVVSFALQDRAEKLYERVSIEKVEPKSGEERRVHEVLTKKEIWLAAIRAVEERIGPFPDGVTVKVGFDWPGDEYAHGGAIADKGWVRFNLKKLGEYQKKVDEIESRRKEAEKQGKRLVFRVPPARFDRMIWHELTHVLQRGHDSPDWFSEGMAVWTADDPNCLAFFANAGKKVEPVESPLADKNDTYARGHLFWKWLESKGVLKKVVDATVFGRKPWKKSLEDATGLPWDKLVAEERDWSAKELEKIRPKGK